VIVLAGEVEAERFTRDDHRLFDQIGGRMCTNTLDLAELLREASLVIGADTGPTHLAAQLGVPTLALFGPTDPSVWAPVGPSVRVIAPDRGVPAPMEWLRIGRVLKEARLTHPQV
jgi:ADP-heptose:LPS heptosyltransferase